MLITEGWDDFEPAPMEFFHGRLMDLFHEWRLTKTTDLNVEISGIDFSSIVVKAKNETYKKYPNQNLQKAIPKIDM